MNATLSKSFGLRLENVPVINLRMDFENVRKYANDLVDAEEADGNSTLPHWRNNLFEIETELNWLMRMSVINIECYVQYAVWETLHRRRLWTADIGVKLRNPFSLGRGTCRVYYHSLPSLISPDISLLRRDPVLWQRTASLYSEVRNPLFHGKQAVEIKPACFAAVIRHLGELYEW
ncbi:MAG: hypothetical protein M3O61_19740, partial [Gemmatimonadota bacterium]|nr:hypothetical protein [Gemmatimonadota bacterium]